MSQRDRKSALMRATSIVAVAALGGCASYSDKLARLQEIIAAQRDRLDAYLPTLEQLVEQARSGFRRRDMSDSKRTAASSCRATRF